MKKGDLVFIKNHQLAIIVDVYTKLSPLNPWVRVYTTQNQEAGYQWCRQRFLKVL